MTKVSVQLPSEKIIAKQKAQLKDHVIDDQGRIIKLRMPDALDEFDLNSALGKDSTNVGCISMAQPLLYIESINGEAFHVPKSYAQIRAAIQKVGRDSILIILEALNDFGEEQKLATDKEQVDAIKK